jgi:hypothetical protein
MRTAKKRVIIYRNGVLKLRLPKAETAKRWGFKPKRLNPRIVRYNKEPNSYAMELDL